MKSNNGNSNFKEIGKVNSKGNSNQIQQYSFEDFSPLSDGNYYRLKQVDNDGKSTYSKTVFVDFGKDIFKKQIDFLEEKAIKNPYFRQVVNQQRQLIYGH